MPPKKKDGKGKSKSKSKKKVTDNSESNEENERLELLQKATSLEGDIVKEGDLSEQFQRQSELLKQYWEIEKKTREERKHAFLEKEHRLKEIKDKHIIDLGEYKHTIKQLLFSNQDELAQNATQSLLEHQSVFNQHQSEIGQLTNELHSISNRINEKITCHEEFKKSLRQKYCDQATELREEASRRVTDLAAYTDKQFKHKREKSDKELKEEIKKLEKRHEIELKEVMETNKEEVHQLRNHYNATINSNLDTITELKKDVLVLKEQDRLDRKVLNELRSQNNRIIEPLKTNKKNIEQLESDLVIFNEQKQDLDAQKRKLHDAEEELKKIEWDHEVLFQKFQELEKDRDAWKQRFQKSIYSTQQKTNFENLMIERKLSRLSLVGEKNTAAIADILEKANIGLDELDQSNVCITDVVKKKNGQVGLLEEKLKKIKTAHSTMRERYQSLIGEYSSNKGKTTIKRPTVVAA